MAVPKGGEVRLEHMPAREYVVWGHRPDGSTTPQQFMTLGAGAELVVEVDLQP